MLTELITGKTVREALRIDDSGIKAMLGGLPAEHEHCAELAVDTLHDALRRYLAHKRTPWKRLYENPE
jgi:nitrogen fixation NifU-like protein